MTKRKKLRPRVYATRPKLQSQSWVTWKMKKKIKRPAGGKYLRSRHQRKLR